VQRIKKTLGRQFLLPVMLAGLTLLVFQPVLRCAFLNYDDDRYVTENPHVLH